ncbi:hypothetical protein, partial [Bifidobacterium longum]
SAPSPPDRPTHTKQRKAGDTAMRAHHVLLLSLCLLAAAYAVLLFVSPAAAPIGVTLTVVGLVLVSTRYAWRAKFLALFNEA